MNKIIWTPQGNYEISGDIQLLDAAAKDYYEKLSVGRNHQTGDICLFIEMPDGFKRPIFGWQEIPSAMELRERLWKADRWKREGDTILNEAFKSAEQVKKEGRKDYEEALEETVEKVEFALRER